MSNKKNTVEQYLQLPWHYCTEASEWEGEKGYWVSVAELPDCSTFTNRLEDGLVLMPRLLKEYLAVALKSSAKIPLPDQAQESILAGKLLLRLPASLHLGIKNAAKREGTSINQFAMKALAEAVIRVAKPASYTGLVREGAGKSGYSANTTTKPAISKSKIKGKSKNQ